MTEYPFARSPRPSDVNYDSSNVATWPLPDPLVALDGSVIDSADAWLERRRPELLSLFEEHVYGRAPREYSVTTEVVAREPHACGGSATRLEVDVSVGSPSFPARSPLTLRLLVWVPNHTDEPAPLFLGLNYFGNHTVHPDPAIRLARGWVLNEPELGIRDYVATEASRGLRARRWPVELLLSRGYGLATLYAGDIDPDYHDGFRNGVHGLFRASDGEWPSDAWGSIAAWAFGLSRALDALQTLEGIDAAQIGAVGHSRFGKAALWAGASDPRFAWAISNNSGRGGAAVSRRRFGELTRHLNARFPHWFAGNFRNFDDREQSMPVDQHELLALLAPRPVYVASATQDLWADPEGELTACVHASGVYGLFGLEGLRPSGAAPAENVSSGDYVGYHRRPGGHDITVADWWHYLAFADRHRARRRR
jgi:hypothetical protein